MSTKESIYGDATLPLVVGEEVAYLTATTPDSNTLICSAISDITLF